MLLCVNGRECPIAQVSSIAVTTVPRARRTLGGAERTLGSGARRIMSTTAPSILSAMRTNAVTALRMT